MNPTRGFIIGIARKFFKPLIERTKCYFTAPPCWPSNMLKILPAYPQMIYNYVKNTQSLRLMFVMIFSNFWKLRHAQESPSSSSSSSYYYYKPADYITIYKTSAVPTNAVLMINREAKTYKLTE